ncbi:MAG: type II secretion system ATPase GspE [Pontibacterium sp.]
MSTASLPPYGFAKKTLTLVTGIQDSEVTVLCCEATEPAAIAELQRFYQRPVNLTQTQESQLMRELGQAYQRQSQNNLGTIDHLSHEVDLDQLAEEIPESEDLLDSQDGAPVIRLINALFAEALKQGASDIHIETFETSMSVRLRIDGTLQEVLTPARALAPLLTSRIKVMAKLDIAEKRIPQDGRISLRMGGRSIDVRISTIPSSHGERVVMRLLDKQATRMDFDNLGMPEHCIRQLQDMLRRPNGILLVTGPTGSGKTTTLYAGLNRLNDRSRNILTVEDPIEYALEGVGQTQVNRKVDMTFARGLRAILRQDPDVVMVGEIRDSETAEVAVQASLTGHLVLSTLHTNDAVGAITRLQDLGVQPYLIASSLLGVLAQRLVRRLCTACRTPHRVTAEEARLLDQPSLQGKAAYRPAGCSLCHHSGYKGRSGIYELLQVTPHLRELIHKDAGEQALLQELAPHMTFMQQEGQRLIAEGITSVDEVLRTVRKEQSDALV